MKLAIGATHGGLELNLDIVISLQTFKHIEVSDFCTAGKDSSTSRDGRRCGANQHQTQMLL